MRRRVQGDNPPVSPFDSLLDTGSNGFAATDKPEPIGLGRGGACRPGNVLGTSWTDEPVGRGCGRGGCEVPTPAPEPTPARDTPDHGDVIIGVNPEGGTAAAADDAAP